MLFCFGFSWPFSIAKGWKARTAKGQSLLFLSMIEAGYVFGITHKLLNNPNWVTWFYVLLLVLVFVNILIYFRNRRFDAESAGKDGQSRKSK